jgi:hypothetical protein
VKQPETNYMNIYKQSVRRLGCFEEMTSNSEDAMQDADDSALNGGYFYGDATAYEHHLDKVLK